MPAHAEAPESGSQALSREERAFLVELAQKAIEAEVRGANPPEAAGVPARLAAPGAVFVSLYQGDTLRGCIGQVFAMEPLYQAVRHAAVAAALSDPRFPPVTTDELAGLRIEISALSPPVEVDASGVEGRILIGRHGVLIESGLQRGVLLPQVPVRYGWQARQFLEQTCVKAGLSADAWRSGARVYLFTAQVFGPAEEAGAGA